MQRQKEIFRTTKTTMTEPEKKINDPTSTYEPSKELIKVPFGVWKHKRTENLYDLKMASYHRDTLEILVHYTQLYESVFVGGKQDGFLAPKLTMWSRNLIDFLEKFQYLPEQNSKDAYFQFNPKTNLIL